MIVTIKEQSIVDEFTVLLTDYGMLSNEEIALIDSVKVSNECITFLKREEQIIQLYFHIIYCRITVTSVITIYVIIKHNDIKLLDVTIEA